MTPVRRIALLVALLAAGFFIAPLLAEFFPTKAEWEQKLQMDAHTGVQVLRPDPRLPENLDGLDEFWDAWDVRLDLYDDEGRAELRRRLHVYLDFLEAEYADAAESYGSGEDAGGPSDTAQLRRDALRTAFGALADTIIEQADALRDEAYRASPEHGGFDPDQPNFRLERERIRAWLPRARARADELTTPRGERSTR